MAYSKHTRMYTHKHIRHTTHGLGLNLVLQVWCFVKHNGLVTLVVIMILKDTATFQVLYNSFSILYLEHHYCGDQRGV